MIDRRWLPLAIRIVGLYIAGASVQGVLRSLGEVFKWIEYSKGSEHPGSVTPYIAFATASIIQLVIGIVLIVKAASLAKRWLGDVNKRCPACLSDIRGVDAEVCPECGGPIKQKLAATIASEVQEARP